MCAFISIISPKGIIFKRKSNQNLNKQSNHPVSKEPTNPNILIISH